MSGSPVIRFRLKPDLVALLEKRGKSASAVAKQIVVADLMEMPLTPERIQILEEVAAEIQDQRPSPFSEDEESLREDWRKLMRERPGEALEIKTFEEFKRRRADG